MLTEQLRKKEKGASEARVQSINSNEKCCTVDARKCATCCLNLNGH